MIKQGIKAVGTFAQKKAVSAVSPSHFYLKLSYDTNHLTGGPPVPPSPSSARASETIVYI